MIASAETSAALYASLATLVTALVGLVAILINTTVTLRGQRETRQAVEAARSNVARKVDNVHADVTEVKRGVESINGQTGTEILEANEGRRIEADIPAAERTVEEQGYVDRLDSPKES